MLALWFPIELLVEKRPTGTAHGYARLVFIVKILSFSDNGIRFAL